MKKLFLILILLPLSLFAQQEEYTAFLEQAVQAAKDNNVKAFNTNLRYFSAAMERDEITPGTLSPKNRELYTEALFQALSYSDIELDESLTKKAIAFIEYDIENNHKNQFSMGRLYDEGKGVPQDYSMAKFWYEKAVAKGNAFAMYYLGYMYHDGLGVRKDISKARYWIQESCKAGNRYACFVLKRL